MGASHHRQEKSAHRGDFLMPERPFRLRAQLSSDVTDADFVVVQGPDCDKATDQIVNPSANPQSGKSQATTGQARAVKSGLADIAEKRLQNISIMVFGGLVIVIGFVSFSVAFGFRTQSASVDVITTASIDEPLRFTNVTLKPRDANGMPILILSGQVENVSPETLSLHPIRAEFLVDGVATSSILVDLPVVALGSGETHAFSARLPYGGGAIPGFRLSFVP